MAPKVQTDLSKKVLSDINGDYKDAYEKMLAKKAEYEVAKKQENIYLMAMQRFESEFKSNPNQESKNKYCAMYSLFSNAEINTNVLRHSVQSYSQTASKVGQSAFLANAILNS